MPIQVRLCANGERKIVAYSDDTTIRVICEENDINTASPPLFDGMCLRDGDYDMTLAELGCVEGDIHTLAKYCKY